MLPRHLNDGTTDSCLSATVEMGGVGKVLGLHQHTTSVLAVLMVSPSLLYVLSAILQFKDPYFVQFGGCF